MSEEDDVAIVSVVYDDADMKKMIDLAWSVVPDEAAPQQEWVDGIIQRAIRPMLERLVGDVVAHRDFLRRMGQL